MIRSILSVIISIVVWGVLWVGGGTGAAATMPDKFNDQGGTFDPGILAA